MWKCLVHDKVLCTCQLISISIGRRTSGNQPACLTSHSETPALLVLGTNIAIPKPDPVCSRRCFFLIHNWILYIPHICVWGGLLWKGSLFIFYFISSYWARANQEKYSSNGRLREPSPTPFPQVWETLGRRQADAGGSFLASGSEEKTVLFFHKLKGILKKSHRLSEKQLGEG